MAKAISRRVITLGRNPVNGKDIELAFFKTGELRGAPYNPRRMRKKEFAGLKASLGRFGLVDLPVWNKRTKQLVAGHQRLVLLRRQRVAETPVIVVDLPEAEEKALNLTLNNPAVAGEWTRGVLGLLDEVKLALPDLSAALRIGEIKLQLDAQPGGGKPGKTDPDAVPEVPKKAVTKRGDLWVLGDHRLLCGDSTKAKDVERLMGGAKADCIFTSPPYGIEIEPRYCDVIVRRWEEFAGKKAVLERA